MMKKDKLYTVNKWNRLMFSPKENLFYDGGLSSYGITPGMINNWITKKGYYKFGNPGFYASMENDANNIKGIPSTTVQTPALEVESKLSGYAKNGFSSIGGDNSPKDIQGNIQAGQGGPGYAGMIGGIASAVGDIPTGERRGMWDTADPLHHLAEGRESAVGNVMGDAGVALFKTGASSGNPYLMLAGGIAKGVGSLVNAAFGMKEDTALKQAVESGISQNQNFNSNANSFDDIQGPRAVVTNTNVYKGGWFTGGKARRKNEELNRRMATAKDLAWRSVYNNVDNISKDQTNNALSQYFAYGGNLFGNNGDMGAIEYDFMDRYLTNYKDKSQQKETLTNLFAGTPSSLFADGGGIHIKNASKWHAFGGDLQTNGADFSTGATHVDAGNSHEMNPYDGVQMGVDAEGTPNLVEEGEVVFDDYVYSNRIPVDAETKRKFHLPKKKDISYADLAKKLEKEIQERPNDPISKAGFNAQMHELADQQERQKQEMEAARAREAFEALSPEEQTAIMQRAAQEEALAQQAAQEQAVAEQQAAQQPSPEEVAMMQQQMQADGSEAMLGQEPQISAYGGKINRFDNGGDLQKVLFNALGIHTMDDFKKFAKEHKIPPRLLKEGETIESIWDNLAEDVKWEDFIKQQEFLDAVKKTNPALAHSLSKNYDFGIYKPTKSDKATIKSISKGNWKAINGEGWFGSEDLAFKQATDGMSDEEIRKLTPEKLAELMKNTDAYKNTSKWLEDSDNALLYLNTLLNDPDTPEVAKEYARKYVEDGKWKNGFTYDYATVFGKDGEGVRETNPGTYWHSVEEANRGNKVTNYVIDKDGNVEEIIGDVPSNWKETNSYSWSGQEDNTDYTNKYYTRPAAKAAEAAAEEEEEQRGVRPVHRSEALRYAGLFGPAVGLGLQMAGVGRPDTSRLDAAVSSIGNTALADYKPLGNYLTYRPMDIWYEQNRMDANARATDRAIINNSAPVGTRMAGLLASGYNNQIADGELYRKALEYNDAKRAQVAEFNRGTDQFNADAYNKLSQFNANAINQDRHLRANMSMQAARDKMDADAGWYNSIYGNIGGLFKGLSDLGRENAQRNMIADMAAAGIFGNMNPDNFNPNGVLRWETDEEMKKNSTNKSAHGGSIKRKKGKRGLTY